MLLCLIIYQLHRSPAAQFFHGKDYVSFDLSAICSVLLQICHIRPHPIRFMPPRCSTGTVYMSTSSVTASRNQDVLIHQINTSCKLVMKPSHVTVSVQASGPCLV